MSEQLYFQCEWIIDLDTGMHIITANKIASELGCSLVTIWPIKLTQEGFTIQVFAIEVPSKLILEEFIEKIGKTMNLNEWKPITREVYLQGATFNPKDFKGLEKTSWVDGLQDASYRNDFIRRNLKKSE